MSKDLHLSHWDAKVPVIIPQSVINDLANYHIMGVRYLYACYAKGQTGAVLNEDDDMNTPIQISTFLGALHTTDSPVIVVCEKQSLQTWHYYLSKYVNNDITVITENNTGNDSSKTILCIVENLKWFKSVNSSFFVVVIDDLDLNLNKRIVKQLKSQFRIGVTKRNFLNHPDQKLFRNMLLWAVPGVVGKLEEFIEEDRAHLINLRFPYSEWWFRLTWSGDTFEKPSVEEKSRMNAAIRTWSKDQNLIVKEEEKVRIKRKRKKETKSDSSQDTVICDEMDVGDLSILNVDDIKPSNSSFDDQETTIISESDVLSVLLGEPKIETDEAADDVESRNQDVLSFLYGD
ncbi:hypothetical protein RN001_014155 [Aquatica leii]|uniref:Uncharacterized protein n=1 Tax=Aquatica leii TaxID=1421715 RepID=A0AAN7NX46_9COLE|nr:hypothetical protein RN001_014155 [Aquatica leii]